MKSVHDLTERELEELRERFFQEILDDGSMQRVLKQIVNKPEEISMDIVKFHYIWTFFVDEDFWCNTQN